MDPQKIRAIFDSIDSLLFDDFKILKSTLNTSIKEDELLYFDSNFFGNLVVIKDDVTKSSNKGLWNKMSKKSCVYAFKAFGDAIIPNGISLHKGQNDRKIRTGQMVYVGKTESALSRIHSHYSRNQSKSSLHLGYESNLKAISKMYLFILKNEFSDYKKYILETMEEYMHRELKIAIGNSRK